ncbi:MAG: MATE family efflux transporter [Bacteroidales bacterium]|nr:MATE family efflux transporter [Bacteroidales bacterium]
MTKDENRTKALETENIGRLLLKYSLPAIVGVLVNTFYNVIDRIFIGHGVGAFAISGLAITFPIVILQGAFGMLIGVGASARISIVLGQKNKLWAEKILGNSIVLSLLFSALFIVLMLTFLDEILTLFGGTPNTIPYAKEYLLILIPGSVFTTLTYSFNNVMRATGYPTKAMNVMITGAIINTVLAPLFIFVFHWGIRGAAVATLISMTTTAVIVIMHFIKKSSFLHFRIENLRLEWQVVKSIVSIGMSPFSMNVAACLVNVILNNALLSHGGELAIGANGVVNSLAIVVIMSVVGLCQGMQPIVGYNYGAGNYDRMKQTLMLTIRVATVVTSVGFAVAMLFPRQIAMAFTTDRELVNIAIDGLRTAFVFMPIIGFQMVTSSFFQSIGKVKISIFLSLSRQVLFLIPMILMLPHFFGLKGVWMATPASDFLSATLTLSILLYNWKSIGK